MGVHLIKASTTVSLQPFTQDYIMLHFQAPNMNAKVPFVVQEHDHPCSIWNGFEEPSGDL